MSEYITPNDGTRSYLALSAFAAISLYYAVKRRRLRSRV